MEIMEKEMAGTISIEGEDVALAKPIEISRGIKAAADVFAKRNADPLAAAAANAKRAADELLTPEEALLCVIWDEAEYVAWHEVTHGWMIRDFDLNLVVR